MIGDRVLHRYGVARSALAAGASLLLLTGAGVGISWVLVMVALTGGALLSVYLAPSGRGKASAVIVGDLVLGMVLVPLTGAESSPFLLLLYTAVIFAGYGLGPRLAIATATAASAVLLGVLLNGSGLVGQLVLPGSSAELPGVHPARVVRSCLTVGFLYTVAVLSSYLGLTFRRRSKLLARARQELNRHRLDTGIIVESLSSGLISMTAKGRVMLLNSSARRILSLGDGPLERRASQLLSGSLAPLGDALFETARSGEAVQREIVRVGRRLIGFTTVPVTTGGEVLGVVCLCQDVTEVQAEQERQNRQERLAAIGELSAGIVHELRNILKPMSGAVELLEEDLDTGDDRGALIRLVREECDALESFVEEFLEYSSDRPLERKPFHVAELLETVASLGRRHPDGQSASIEVDPVDDVLMAGDRAALQRALYNLVLNAVHAKPEGRIRLGASSLDRQELALTVQDEGPGIDRSIHDRVFEPFFTTKSGGTGLGLAVVRRTAERHGGSISLVAPDEGGARFEIRLPLSLDEAEPGRRAA